jgi:hypothetical protein
MVSAKDRELEETEERHQMEVKIYKQKVKHLLYEQENHLAGLKAENMVRISCSKLCHFLDVDCWKVFCLVRAIKFFIQVHSRSWHLLQTQKVLLTFYTLRDYFSSIK